MFSKISNFLIIGCIIYPAGLAYTIYGLEEINTGNEISELSQNSENVVGPCGVRDHASPTSPENHSRFRRYILADTKWDKKVITYKISNYTSTLNKSVVDKGISRSFSEWAKYIPLNFKQIYEGKADIEILFKHIDGPWKVLAYASYPRKGAYIHFDDSEKWAATWTRGAANLQTTSLHEIGHSLGLKHAENVPHGASVMWYGGKIKQDDIDAVQKLYGKREPNDKLLPEQLADKL